MRTKEEIEHEHKAAEAFGVTTHVEDLMIELLLDIRELLKDVANK